MSLIAILPFLLALGLAMASHELPERCRGGSAYKKLLQSKAANNALIFTQKTDHFNDDCNCTFAQRYFVDDTYYTEGSDAPIFFEIGGEGTLSGAPAGYLATLAKQYSAKLVALEHRFYGESIPGGNSETENLKKHLTVEQALADLNAFTQQYTADHNLKGKWFVFGGSYPGALSSWYRNAYPEASVGSLSSSGVVNPIVDFYQFDEQVSSASGNVCGTRLKKVNEAFEEQLRTKDGFAYSKGQMECESDMAETDFLYMIADSYSMMVQYGGKSKLCDTILAIPESDLTTERLTTVFSELSKEYWGAEFCSQGFYNTAALKDPARWDTNSRSWRWQTCYQVAWFNTAPSQGSVRSESVNLDYHLKQCAEIFGYKMFPAVTPLIKKFGGDSPTAHNVFYSDFSDDPWQRASVNYPPGVDQPYGYAFCDDCGHCADFHEPTDADHQHLKDERAEFEKYLKLWLDE
jgi:hypothetical protein